MKYFTKILPLTFLLIYCVTAQEADKPIVSKGELLFYIDNTSFLGTEGKTYTEFHLMLYADQLKSIKKDERSTAEIELQAIIRNKSNEIVNQNAWITEVLVDSSADVRSLAVYDLWGIFVSPGTYNFSLSVKDKRTNKNGVINTPLVIPEVDSLKLKTSQICFINGIKKSVKEFSDRKNSIIPNPSRRFGLLNPQLIFYYEIYSPFQSLDAVLKAEYLIKDVKGKVVKSISDVEINDLSSTKRITQAINISKLLSGIYTFEILVKNSGGVQVASAHRNFEIIQPDFFSEKTIGLQEKLGVLENILSYISTPHQLNIYKNLETIDKASFLVRFFRDLDPTPETIKNEYLEDLLQRYNTSNMNFSWGMIDGWKTERARVFIQYGKPDEIENFTFEEDARPYEIWYYRKDRELYFVFGDLLSNGNYALLHSNKEGEIYNPSWKELIIKL